MTIEIGDRVRVVSSLRECKKKLRESIVPRPLVLSHVDGWCFLWCFFLVLWEERVSCVPTVASGRVVAAFFGPCEIYRTNASLLMEAIASIGGEDRIAFQGGAGKLTGELSVSADLVVNATSVFYA